MGKLINEVILLTVWDDFGKCPIDGYIQTGNTDGRYYGHWFRQFEDGTYVNINWGSETQKFWVSVRNCYHGSCATLEDAVNKVEELIGG